MAVSYKKLWKILIDKDMKKSDLERKPFCHRTPLQHFRRACRNSLHSTFYIYRYAAPFGRRAEGHLPGYRYLRCHHTPHARAGRAKRIHCANKRKRHCFRKTHRGKIQLPRRTFRRHFRVCMHAFRQIQKPARSVK